MDVFDPDPDTIFIEDIAHHLSCLPRFAGGTKWPYCVGAHSILVSIIVPMEFALEGLLHDAPEYLLGDLGSPIKRHDLLEGYRVLHGNMARAIATRYYLSHKGMSPEVHLADQIAVVAEANVLKHGIKEWADYEELKDLDTSNAEASYLLARPHTPQEIERDFRIRFERCLDYRDKYIGKRPRDLAHGHYPPKVIPEALRDVPEFAKV